MPYPEIMIRPMREELTRLGARELKTPAQVDETLQNSEGTVMVVVNSICGCAAGKARPAVAMALQHETRPDQVVTVFAGADIEATEKARGYFTDYPPSSPSIALLKDGKLVYMLERRQIEGRDAPSIAEDLKRAFDLHCSPVVAGINNR
ncbi:MAG TPA: BrxA/BrxB family bacilliredoxin [Pyrinomonadaceae bacterium]|nr:BrxA/BrxB family bacilliredoxin [Pyrinomonadaceae bacterium]